MKQNNRNVVRRKAGRKRIAWGDWRPFAAGSMVWGTTNLLATAAIAAQEIAGQSIPAGAIPAIPFDPGTQLAAAAGVTLVEEETFTVQVKGHFDITITVAGAALPATFTLQHGLYRARYSQALVGFVPPTFTVQGIADVNWLMRKHQTWTGATAVGSGLTTPTRIMLSVSGTLTIRQGDALYAAIQATYGLGAINYTSWLEYRIRRNVD